MHVGLTFSLVSNQWRINRWHSLAIIVSMEYLALYLNFPNIALRVGFTPNPYRLFFRPPSPRLPVLLILFPTHARSLSTPAASVRRPLQTRHLRRQLSLFPGRSVPRIDSISRGLSENLAVQAYHSLVVHVARWNIAERRKLSNTIGN